MRRRASFREPTASAPLRRLHPAGSGASVGQIDCFVRADLKIGCLRRLTVGVFPRRSTRQLLPHEASNSAVRTARSICANMAASQALWQSRRPQTSARPDSPHCLDQSGRRYVGQRRRQGAQRPRPRHCTPRPMVGEHRYRRACSARIGACNPLRTPALRNGPRVCDEPPTGGEVDQTVRLASSIFAHLGRRNPSS